MDNHGTFDSAHGWGKPERQGIIARIGGGSGRRLPSQLVPVCAIIDVIKDTNFPESMCSKIPGERGENY